MPRVRSDDYEAKSQAIMDCAAALFARLETLDGFEGEVDALPEGTPAFAGKACRTDGTAFSILDTPVVLYTPLAQARTDAAAMVEPLADHPDLYYTGYTQDALKEVVEAHLVYAFVTG